MEFLASLAIKALIGASICGTVTVGAVYGYDKTLLGFKDNTKTTIDDQGQGGLTEPETSVENDVKPDIPVKGAEDRESTTDTATDTKPEVDTNEGGIGPDGNIQEKPGSPTLAPIAPKEEENTKSTGDTVTMSVTDPKPEPDVEVPTDTEAPTQPIVGA